MASTDTGNGEEYDAFPTDAPNFVLDSDSLDVVRDTSRAGVNNRGVRGYYGGGSRASRSAATTQLATDVGSTVGQIGRNPFLKSVTFFDPKIYYRRNNDDQVKELEGGEQAAVGSDGDDIDNNHDDDDITIEVNDLTHWDIILREESPMDELRPRKSGIFGKLSNNLKKNKRPQLVVADYEGLVEFSSLEAGDRLVSINKKKIRPEDYSADEAMAFMRQCLEDDGVLHVTTENPQGKDIIVNVTVIKPRPNMTYEELGLVVWNWPHLCVREIKKDSIFQHTAVRETDQIAAINDIDCGKMKEKAFAKCVLELETEITITLIRRKHRYTGSYT